jgi:hypothetical protein
MNGIFLQRDLCVLYQNFDKRRTENVDMLLLGFTNTWLEHSAGEFLKMTNKSS